MYDKDLKILKEKYQAMHSEIDRKNNNILKEFEDYEGDKDPFVQGSESVLNKLKDLIGEEVRVLHRYGQMKGVLQYVKHNPYYNNPKYPSHYKEDDPESFLVIGRSNKLSFNIKDVEAYDPNNGDIHLL